MLRDWVTFWLDFLLPPRATERLMRTLTLEELQELSYVTENGSLPYSNAAVKALVWELKYHRDNRAAAIAGEFISDALLAAAADELGKPLLVPIPMHKKRRRERRHNQTETLCEAALTHVGEAYEYAPRALTRVHYTEQQQGLAKNIRLNNVKGSMEASELVKGRVCVVVDDVSTTGATFEEAKRALKLAGARGVVCVALAES